MQPTETPQAFTVEAAEAVAKSFYEAHGTEGWAKLDETHRGAFTHWMREALNESGPLLLAEVVLLRGQVTAATEAVAGPFALYVHDVCWGNGYETLDLALGDALEAISDRGSIDGVEIRAVATLGAQQ